MSKRMKISWLKETEKKDYSAAELYLTLVFERRVATKFVSRLRKVAVSHYIARDALWAAAASILGGAACRRTTPQGSGDWIAAEQDAERCGGGPDRSNARYRSEADLREGFARVQARLSARLPRTAEESPWRVIRKLNWGDFHGQD
jgi:hypothetical protein